VIVDYAGKDTMNENPGDTPAPANIADPFWDLLLPLDDARRQGFIRRLAVGYYENWRPTRTEVAYLVDLELGRLSAQQLAGPTPSTLGQGQYAALAADHPGRPADDEITHQSRALRAVHSPTTESADAAPRGIKLASFNVDCGLLAPPFRFIAAGLSSAGWTIRLGQRYRRTFLHYRLISPVSGAENESAPAAPITFNADIACVPDVAVPQVATDGRSLKHSVGRGIVVGSRGPWPIADGATAMNFLITAQAPPGSRRQLPPAGSLRVDLRSGTAAWLSSSGYADSSGGRAATR
jgi:hypothetical protein